WLEASGHEGDFVGVRRPFDWGPGSFRARMEVVDSDPQGDWFEFSVLNLGTGDRRVAGCLRFPRGGNERARMKDGGGTWIECYSGANDPTGLPFFHATVTSVVALTGDGRHPARHARSTYTDYPNLTQVDVEFDPTNGHVHMRCGRGVTLIHPAGPLF